jgi:outer membrane protein assembly factor BamA
MDISRLNLGIDFKQNNFRGRNETLQFTVKQGFRSLYRINYQIPFINKAKTIGLSVDLLSNEFNNPDFAIIDNRGVALERLLEENVGDNLRIMRRAHITLNRRKQYYLTQGIRVGYRGERIDSLLYRQNTDYLTSRGTSQDLLFASYFLTYNNTNFAAYPTQGMAFSGIIEQHGFKLLDNVAITKFIARFSHHVELTDKLSMSNGLRGVFLVGQDPGYDLSLEFGFYGNIVRGYDAYSGLSKNLVIQNNTLRYKLFEGDVKMPSFIPDQFGNIPLSLYPKIYVDGGYFRLPNPDPTNTLSNKPLLGFGFGFDVISFYNSVARFEWSVNIDDGDIRIGPYYYFSVAI